MKINESATISNVNPKKKQYKALKRMISKWKAMKFKWNTWWSALIPSGTWRFRTAGTKM